MLYIFLFAIFLCAYQGGVSDGYDLAVKKQEQRDKPCL